MTLASIDTNRGASGGARAGKVSTAAPVAGAGLRAARPSLAVRRSSMAAPPAEGAHRRADGARASLARAGLSLGTPSHRRSTMGRASLAPGAAAPGAALKDSRLRMRNARGAMEANVTSFLEDTGFAMSGWSSRQVHEPTQSAFVAIFKHIYAECVDPSYELGADGRKFEEDVILLLRDLRYPFVDELTKTKLTAAGSQQNWPACLAMLDWIVRLQADVDKIGSGPLARSEEESELHALFFPYLWRCYDRFWDNQDAYPEEMAELERSFAAKNEQIHTSVAELEKQKQAVDEELHSFTSKESPLQRERREYDVIRGDIAKFTKYHDEVLQPKLDKSRRTIQRLQEALREHHEELHAKQEERARRQKLVDAQHVSADEFERMTAERERVAHELEQLAQQNRQAVEHCWKVELELAKRQAEVEQHFQTLNPIARSVHLLPLRLPGGGELEELALAPTNPETLLPRGLDMRKGVRARIEVLRTVEMDKYRTLSDSRAALQETLDELLEGLEQVRRQVRGAETRLETLKGQIDEMNRLENEEADAAAAESTCQEGVISSMEHSSLMALQQADARLAALKIQLQEGIDTTEAERAMMHEEMCSALHTLLDLKVRVAEGLDAVGHAVGAPRS